MAVVSVGLALIVAGCPICPDDELRVVQGAVPVAPGAEVGFEVQYGDKTYDSCALHWYVNEIEGGDATVGRITGCGVYTAPAAPTLESVVIYGAEHGLGCADCCPGSARTVALSQAPR